MKFKDKLDLDEVSHGASPFINSNHTAQNMLFLSKEQFRGKMYGQVSFTRKGGLGGISSKVMDLKSAQDLYEELIVVINRKVKE